MRKVLSLIASVAIAFVVLAPTVTAAWPVNGECDHFAVGNYFGGMNVREESGVAKTGVSTDIYTDTARFQPCTGPWLNEIGGVSAWAALMGAIPNEPYPYSIAQIGVIKCNNVNRGEYADSACTAERVGKLVYFYAFGWNYYVECNSSSHAPRAIYLGDVPSAAYHNFKVVWRKDLGRIWFYRDGAVVANISDVNFCWLLSSPYPPRAGNFAERWDPNDGFGGVGPVHFDNTRYSTSTSAPVWKTAAQSSCAGAVLDPEFQCSFFSSDHFGISTVNQ